ncbi:MAG: hypothetical protein U0792_09275 [Gemmataceae bacterium]
MPPAPNAVLFLNFRGAGALAVPAPEVLLTGPFTVAGNGKVAG